MLAMRTLAFVIPLLILPLCVSAQSVKQQSDMALEVFQMTQSMDELIGLLKEERTQNDRGAELQKLEIAVTYLNFRSRRIEAKEQELNEKRQSRDRMQELVAKIEDDPEQWERFDKNADSGPIPSSFEERPSEYRLKMLKERIDKQDTEVVKLEAEIMDLSRELADFETFVQKNLELIK